MTDKKFMDKEIIKALEERLSCGKWIGKGYLDKKDFKLLKDALDLINRRDAEIERLNKEIDRLSQCVLYHEGHISDAIKEFAEKHKEIMRCFLYDDSTDFLMKWCEYETCTDNLVKEMVGEPNET